jgi:flagellar protein FlaG
MNSSPGGNDLPPAEPVPQVDVGRAVEQLNQLARGSKRSLRFTVDEHSGRTVITVINAATAEVVRQIPPEEALALARRFAALGSLISTEA